MFFLLRLGLDANDYSIFKKFMEEFIEKNVFDQTNIGWGTRYAEFSLKNEDYLLAKSMYQLLRNRFPDNARPVNGLGRVHLAQNQQEKQEGYSRPQLKWPRRIMIVG